MLALKDMAINAKKTDTRLTIAENVIVSLVKKASDTNVFIADEAERTLLAVVESISETKAINNLVVQQN